MKIMVVIINVADNWLSWEKLLENTKLATTNERKVDINPE